MNYALLSKYLGFFAGAVGLLFLFPMAWAVWFQEWSALTGLVAAMAIAMAIGGILYVLGRNANNTLYQREALGLVALAWLLAVALGALPFICTGSMGVFDAIFESGSGITTTGASVLNDIQALPKSVLFWRMFTHWLGGMGIVVLFVAVLPYLGAGGKQLFRSESTGPDPHGIRPRVRESASMLYRIYFGLTALHLLALMATRRMSFFDALCHTFSTLATGGFSTQNESIAFYDSILVETIIIFTMIIASTNFSLYFAMMRGNLTSIFKDTEWRVFIGLIVVCTILVTANLALPYGRDGVPHFRETTGEQIKHVHHTGIHAFRIAAFQVVSVITTTGYSTDDFDQWPHFSRMILVLLMFIGGCAGSTAGGMKIIRMIILIKMAYHRLESTFRPKRIRALRIGGNIIDDDVQQMVGAFFILNFVWILVGALLMSLLGFPIVSAVSATIACLHNIGPGLELVGPTQNFGSLPGIGKLFLTFCMILGRLEMFTITVLLIPSFWRVGR